MFALEFGEILHSFPARSSKRSASTYDVMTPSAARGILDCIHWKPAIRWVIDRIHVLKPIRHDTVRRNEVGKRLPYAMARQMTQRGEADMVLFADEEREQRASLLLRDVSYVIDAHFELTPEAGPTENSGKHADMAQRRITRGQCVQQPCFGCREFPAFFEPVPPEARFDSGTSRPARSRVDTARHRFCPKCDAAFLPRAACRCRIGRAPASLRCARFREPGMILSALNGLYKRTVGTEGGPPPLGYAEIPVVGALDISEAGELLQVQDLRREEKVGKKARLVPRRCPVPQPPLGRTAGVRAGFLCDNAGYLLGHDAKGNAKRAISQFAASRTFHEVVLAGLDDRAATAIIAFFRSWDPANAAAFLAKEAEEMATRWLVLRDAETGCFFHEMPAIRAAWDRHSATTAAPRGQCLVTGQSDEPIALIHPLVKGVQGQGAKPSGAALVSFNCDAFSSYNKLQNLNAPIGTATAFAYTTALNHLLRPESRRKLRIGDATVVVWAERETPAERVIASILGAVSDEEGELSEENRARPVHDQLLRIAAGRWADEPEFAADDHVRFFVLSLAPNAARLQLRFFYTATLCELLCNLQAHCRDILLRDPEPGVRVPTLWTLVRETLPKDQDGRARSDDSAQRKLNKVHGDLARAVLTGLDYPQSLLPVVLDRFRSDRRLSPARLGLVKGCINRHRRLAGGFQPEIAMGLDETSNEPGYVLGRLFALLENMQELSRGSAGRNQPTIRDRFMSSASVTPRSVFSHLLDLEGAHERKAKRDHPGIAHAAARSLGVFINRIGDFPPQLDPHQQGLFFIGYHHQRQARFAGRAQEVAETDDNGSDQTPEE